MLFQKILLSIFLTAVIYQENVAVNVDKVINKRYAEVSKNVQRYSYNQNHPPFAEEYAPIPVSIVYEEPSRSKSKLVSTTETAPTTFHPKFRNLVVVSADIAKVTSALNSNDEETRSTSTLGSTDKKVTPTIDGKTNIQVKGKYKVESELQIPVAVIYDNEYSNLRGNPSVPKAGIIKTQDQREISDISKLNSSFESQKSTEPRTRSYEILSRRKPQSPETLDGITEQISTVRQSKAKPTRLDDTERVPVRAKTQQRRRQRPRIEAENTMDLATAPKTESNFNSDARPALSSSGSNQNIDTRLSSRQRLQPKTTVVNQTPTEILNSKSNINETNLDDSKVTPQQNQPTNVVGNDIVKVDNNTVLSGTSNTKPNPQRMRRPVISNLNAMPAVTLQTNESEVAKLNSEKAFQGVKNQTNFSQQRRQQPASNPKPAIKYEITNPEITEQTTNKDDRITQDEHGSTESATTERIQDQYQNPPQRKHLNNPSNSPNTENISETQKGSQSMTKGTGFPAIVSTTNSRTQPQRRRQPIRTAKEDHKSHDLINATQAKDIEHAEKLSQPPFKAEIMQTRSSGNRNSEAARISRKRDPVVPIIESENHVYGNTGEFHYSYESGDGTKQYGDGVLKPFDDDVNGESVVGGFSYTDKEGNDFSLTYTADEKGYRPVGAHLPTPPPIPPAIARALAHLATKTTPAEYDEVTESL